MIDRSEEINELAAALVAAQGEFSAVPKSSENPFYKSKYAALPDVVGAASPILKEHGLAVSQFPGADEHGDTLTTWLIHSSGQFIRESMRLHLSKDDAQSQGSATTYARRYAYMGVLGLVADEDDDGNRATQSKQRDRNGADKLPPRRSALLTAEQRQRVLTGINASSLKLDTALMMVGVESPDALTVDHARQLAKILEVGPSDVPADETL